MFVLHFFANLLIHRAHAHYVDLRARCGRTNYNRSSMQLLVLRTLMKDARRSLIR